METHFIIKRIADNGIVIFESQEKEVLIKQRRIKELMKDNLFTGLVKLKFKTCVIHIIKDLVSKGAESIALGGTEFPLLIFRS